MTRRESPTTPRLAGDDATLASASAAACRLAVARGASREAIEHGQRALATEGVLTDDERADLGPHLATALHMAARIDEGISMVSDSVEHWRRRGDEQREAAALNALGQLLVARGRTADGMVAASRAVEVLERHPPGRELANAYIRLTSLHMLARQREAA